ncbi:hypothetical protein [uncultured Friedmanniella sp.]|uniref:hypothetical protein n=1 Tax=uncultured Friedmanniella sp. TaxID=335381 RepID=UPI0035CA2D4F
MSFKRDRRVKHHYDIARRVVLCRYADELTVALQELAAEEALAEALRERRTELQTELLLMGWEIRQQLADCGPSVEDVAWGLVPGWKSSLTDLLETAKTVAA